MPTLQEQFGAIDIYLFDQLLKSRIVAGMKVVDAGCGAGRSAASRGRVLGTRRKVIA